MRVDYHVKNEAGDGHQIYCKACMCYIDRERRAGKKPVLVPTVEHKQCRCKLDTACRATTSVIGTSASNRWLANRTCMGGIDCESVAQAALPGYSLVPVQWQSQKGLPTDSAAGRTLTLSNARDKLLCKLAAGPPQHSCLHCSKCQKTKLAAAFWKVRRNSDGLNTQCKECATRQTVKAPATQQKVPLRPQTPPWIYLL